MKRLLSLATIGLLLFIGCRNGSDTGAASGDEQGFEVPASTFLPQDREALQAAKDGWWTRSMENHDARIAWFRDARFGCFVHWGVYSVPGGIWKGREVKGYSEHLMRKERIPVEEYRQTLVEPFCPELFNADEWMQHVADAGMKYFIITSKHHDGFAMFPSDAYPYDIRLTRFGRDPMRELCDAARKRGIKFGFYYSHAFDWEHPDAPGNDWEFDHPGGDRRLGGANWWESEEYRPYLAQAERYVREKSIPQIQELIRNYQPDILWFDTPGKLPLYLNVRILEAVREADPEGRIVVNGRLARFGSSQLGDYTSTGDRAAFFHDVPGDWESIPTTNESYGYSVVDSLRKPASHFVRLLASAVSRGGNILMNVGPKGDGSWDVRDAALTHRIGDWLQENGESIYGAGASGLPLQSWGVTTRKGDLLYVHVFDWPEDGVLTLGGLKAPIKKGWVLSDPKQKVSFERLGELDYQIHLPAVRPDTLNTVLALRLGKGPDPDSLRLLDGNREQVLYAFDAQLLGKGLGYGDGKRNRNYVRNWTSEKQGLQWDFRLNEAADFAVCLDYNTVSAEDSGTVVLSFGDTQLEIPYTGFPEAKGTASLQAGSIHLEPGQTTCTLSGKGHEGAQYLCPIAVRLVRK